jgi:hypothetical protein
MDQRWFAVGHSSREEASEAGREAAAEVGAGGSPKLAVVFASCDYVVAMGGEGLEVATGAGFYTYGEIARTRGISGFHNQTLVVLAVA